MFCGPAAETKFPDRRNHVGAGKDYEDAIYLADHLCGSIEEIEAYIRWLQIRAEEMIDLDPNWQVVQAIAAALLDHGTLGGRRLRAIIKQAFDAMLQTAHTPTACS
jgi:hypothetical protein